MNIKNPQYVINSLSNQVAALAQEKALRDAIITEQQQELTEVKKELDNLRQQLEDVTKNLEELKALREKEKAQKK